MKYVTFALVSLVTLTQTGCCGLNLCGVGPCDVLGWMAAAVKASFACNVCG